MPACAAVRSGTDHAGPPMRNHLMQVLKNAWYAAIWGADLAAGTLVRRRLLGEDMVIFRAADGTPRALADACAHKLAPLHLGTLLPGDRLKCNYHGLVFDAQGQCV